VLSALQDKMGSGAQCFDVLANESTMYSFGDVYKPSGEGKFAYHADAVPLTVHGSHHLADEVKVVVGVFERNDKPFEVNKQYRSV
jgi:hypothetical protein